MSPTDTAATDGAVSSTVVRKGVVDVDVHEQLDSLETLKPYIEQPWSRWVGNSVFDIPDVYFLYPIDPLLEEAKDAPVSRGKTPLAATRVETVQEQLLDRYDLQFAVLTGRFHPSAMRCQPEAAVALATAYNNWLIENWLSRDERLRGSVHIAAQDLDGAVAEIERIGSHPQIVQVMLPLDSWRWAEQRYHPIFAAAERQNLRIALQPVAGLTPGSLGPPSTFYEWHATVQQSFMSQISSFVFHGVFQKYPGIRVIALQGGFSWVQSAMGRMDHNYLGLRPEVPWVTRLPSDLVREHCVFGTYPLDVPSGHELSRVVAGMGRADMVVYSGGFPHFDFDDPGSALPEDTPDELRQQILTASACAFYEANDENGRGA